MEEALKKTSSQDVADHILRFIQENIPHEYSLWESAKDVDEDSV